MSADEMQTWLVWIFVVYVVVVVISAGLMIRAVIKRHNRRYGKRTER